MSKVYILFHAIKNIYNQKKNKYGTCFSFQPMSAGDGFPDFSPMFANEYFCSMSTRPYRFNLK